MMKIVKNFLLVLFFIIIFYGCTDSDINTITVMPGTIETTIEKDSILDTNNIEVIVKYSDNSTKNIKRDDLIIGDIDTSTTGHKNLQITYKDYSFVLSIEVVEKENNVVLTLFNSGIVNDYLSNIKEQENSQEDFILKDDFYTVGDDNPFDFRINAKGIDSNGNITNNISNINANITCELVENIDGSNKFTLLENDNLNQYVSINYNDLSLDFTDLAIGKNFRINVCAENYDVDYFDEKPSFSLIVHIVDGYNVYNATDLSVLDNSGNFGWNDKKSTEIQEVCNSINGVILHDDITIKDNDLPAGLFYNNTEAKAIASGVTNQEIVGSMKDFHDEEVYGRYLNAGQKFVINGNFYQIDFSKVSKVVVQSNNSNGIISSDNGDENAITTHSTLFRFKPKNNNTFFPKVEIKNLSFKGNGKRSSRAIESGGLLLLKSEGVDFTANNTIYQDCLIGYMFERYNGGNTLNSDTDLSSFKILNTKGYNCYNSLLYFWGPKNVMIENSEFIGAGGPVMIVDHVDNDQNTGAGGFSTTVNVINSKLESFVTGEEPWFVTYGATPVVASLKSADNLLYGQIPETSRPTFLVDKDNIQDMMNLVCVMKSAESEGLTNSRIRGKVTIYSSKSDFESQKNDGDKSYGLYCQDEISPNNLIDKARGIKGDNFPYTFDANNSAHYFQSNTTGGYIGSNGDINGEFYIGDYVNIYLANGMCAVMQLFSVK